VTQVVLLQERDQVVAVPAALMASVQRVPSRRSSGLPSGKLQHAAWSCRSTGWVVCSATRAAA
jgi:hypothetical protein